jgi:hypothetical protein
MTINYKNAVQDIKSTWVEWDFGDLPSGTFVGLSYLPAGAIVVGGGAYALTASDAVTSEVVTVGTAASASLYGSIASSKTAGRTALTLLGTTALGVPTAGQTLVGFTRTAVGAVTVGHYALHIEYVIAGNSDETMGVASPT